MADQKHRRCTNHLLLSFFLFFFFKVFCPKALTGHSKVTHSVNEREKSVTYHWKNGVGGEFRHCRKHLQGYKSWVKRSDKQQVDETKEKKKRGRGVKCRWENPLQGGCISVIFFGQLEKKKIKSGKSCLAPALKQHYLHEFKRCFINKFLFFF